MRRMLILYQLIIMMCFFFELLLVTVLIQKIHKVFLKYDVPISIEVILFFLSIIMLVALNYFTIQYVAMEIMIGILRFIELFI